MYRTMIEVASDTAIGTTMEQIGTFEVGGENNSDVSKTDYASQRINRNGIPGGTLNESLQKSQTDICQ